MTVTQLTSLRSTSRAIWPEANWGSVISIWITPLTNRRSVDPFTSSLSVYHLPSSIAYGTWAMVVLVPATFFRTSTSYGVPL